MAATAAAQDEAHLLGEWARLLFGTLHAAGVSDVFISPGSRSTPFTWQALRTRGLGCHAIIDERCAAFAALGFARATGRPAALLCTSGSAPAHYFPALIEATLAFLPLLVITADRPFEAQHAGAAQTIDQLKLYGDHVRRFFELGLPDGAPDALIGLRRAVTQAVAIARGPVPGPVHLNARARKPLEPCVAVGSAQSALRGRVSALLAAPLTRHAPTLSTPSPEALREIAQALMSARAGAIVLGPLAPPCRALADSLGELASALGYPILAESSSQMRHALKEHPLACPEFGWLLCSARLRRRHPCDVLLCLGATPTCVEIERWALDSAASRHVLGEYECPDPTGAAVVLAPGDLAASLHALRRHVGSSAHRPGAAQRAFSAALLAADRVCRTLVSEELAREPGIAEGAAVACVARELPREAQLCLGNSLPIRDLDAYAADGAAAVILSQRGANGIDGLIAGAAGSALGSARPTLLLLGDVSLVHDLGGLAVARVLHTPLVLAVLDNDGGRIFDQLPVRDLYGTEAAAGRGDDTDVDGDGDGDTDIDGDPAAAAGNGAGGAPRGANFWRTPPGCDFRHAAGLFGLQYAAPATTAELASAIRAALVTHGATLLHVRVGADSARAVRARVLSRLAALPLEPAA
jgi:2-succinyl-5-enolpyruvyl-6-hydroxy-3-cyclohexene-1-carboxylate synthase